MDIKEEIKIIRSCTEEISNLLNHLIIKVDGKLIYNPETDARIGICLDNIDESINKIEDKAGCNLNRIPEHLIVK